MMIGRLPWSAVVALTLVALTSGMALCAPMLQQIAPPGPTELVIYSDFAQAVVRQQSAVRLSQGANTVGFQWATDSLDAASIRLQGAQGLTIGEVTQPAGQTKTYQWSVTAPRDGVYPLTTSFMLSGLKWVADYRLATNADRPSALLSGWVTITNGTGMDLRNMKASLILGRPGASADGMEQAAYPLPELRDLPKGASLRLMFLRPMELPVWTIHRIDGEAAPEKVARLLEVQPPSEGALARTALPSGALTVLSPRGIVRATLTYEPGKAFEIAMGDERDIVVKRRLMEREKTGIEFDRVGAVSGFDTIERYSVELRSHLDEALEVELQEVVLKTWEIDTAAEYELEDGRARIPLALPAQGECALEFTLTKHSGTRIP